MSSINKDIALFIENNNDRDLYLNGVTILLKLLENILREPQNLKFRKIRLENKTIKEKLVSLNGMKNLLLAIGFQQYNNGVEVEFILPPHSLLAKVKNYREFMFERQQFISSSENETISNSSADKEICNGLASSSSELKASTSSKKAPRSILKIQPCKAYLERISFPTVLTMNNKFLRSVEAHSDQVMQYEDKNLLDIGKKIIPLKRLTDAAFKKLRYIQKEISKQNVENKISEEPCMKDLILIELTDWFNTEFFEWINEMPCKICKSTKNCKRYNSVDNNIRVEISFCCGVETKFYRYNDIVYLLKTRRGRCGEYANCFTFFCRCLGYDARLVYATFDHVWTEVYSVKQKRWIHVDPSDNVIDAPLMYQHGWKREIDYVFAYSCDNLQDVTWRYTKDHKNRNKASELELLHAFEVVRRKRQINITKTRKIYIIKRTLRELVELMQPREPTENERKGRSSGSMVWRLDRGEQSANFYVFELNELEVNSKQFNLRYSCSNNEYQRYIKDNLNAIKVNQTYSGWETVNYTSKNIFRKIEKDWKMVYLCRLENAEHGELVWKFDFQKYNLKIKKCSLKIDRETFETGQADLILADLNNTEVSDIESSFGFYLKVKLYGGNGDVAWQHAQLFRQNLSGIEFPFDINLEFY